MILLWCALLMKINKMENKAFKTADVDGTELTKVHVNGAAASTSARTEATCSPEVCRNARQRFQPPDLADSPWHEKKTYFFIGIIVLLIVWIIVYATLSRFNLL